MVRSSGNIDPPQQASAIWEISRLFLRLGLTAFGGPAAHVNLMQREFVERRKWITREQFLDLVGACNLLPGPGSTQVAMALGYTRSGWIGLIVAGACFILPASLATLALAWTYVRYGNLPQVQGLLYGAKPVMIAIIVQAVWNLGRTAFRRWPLALIGLASFAAVLINVPPLAVLFAAGALAVPVTRLHRSRHAAFGIATLPSALSPGALATTAPGAVGLLPILLVFLKLGVVVFGSGYVLLVFLKSDLVDRLHWITQPQLLDAITAGQITPGPVFATATFLGYLLNGWTGAAIATAAIFLPSFLMAAAVGALTGRIRRSISASAFLDGVNAAAVALMASVVIVLARATFVDGWTWGIGIVSALLLIRFHLNSTWFVLAGAALGILLHRSA
ncbi:MAG: chromate efflux transporter [Terracidiphilus sp.]|jgi:chromate transporter